MARQDDAKAAALAASGTLNSDPQKVTDPAFTAGGFFDPADLLQVKYEMVRQVEVEGVPVSAAARAFGFARQSVYNARAALAAGGLAALIPDKPGPKGGHKLTGPVLDHLEALLELDPGLTYGELAARAAQRFGIQVHPRSVRRALERRSPIRGRDRRTGGAQKRPPRLIAATRRRSQAQTRRSAAMWPCARSRWPARRRLAVSAARAGQPGNGVLACPGARHRSRRP